jgi:hypothetical protein
MAVTNSNATRNLSDGAPAPLTQNAGTWFTLIGATGGTVHNSGVHLNTPAGITDAAHYRVHLAGMGTKLVIRDYHTHDASGTAAVVQVFGFDARGSGGNFWSLRNSAGDTDATMYSATTDDDSKYSVPRGTAHVFDLNGAVDVMAVIKTKHDSGTAAHTAAWFLQGKVI